MREVQAGDRAHAFAAGLHGGPHEDLPAGGDGGIRARHAEFQTKPNRPTTDHELTVYHCMPHGLRDPLRRRIIPGAFVNTTSVHTTEAEGAGAHQSQQDWLDQSQGMNSYLLAMEDMSLEVGRLSRKFKHAEGWRRHLHLGFCGPDADPLRTP